MPCQKGHQFRPPSLSPFLFLPRVRKGKCRSSVHRQTGDLHLEREKKAGAEQKRPGSMDGPSHSLSRVLALQVARGAHGHVGNTRARRAHRYLGHAQSVDTRGYANTRGVGNRCLSCPGSLVPDAGTRGQRGWGRSLGRETEAGVGVGGGETRPT